MSKTGVLVLSGATEAVIGLKFYRHVSLRSDAFNYYNIASNLANGNGFSDHFPEIHSTLVHSTAWRPPLYPVILAVAFFFFGTHLFIAQLVNSTMTVIDSVLIYSLVVQTLSDKIGNTASNKNISVAGMAASLIFITYPPLFSNTFVPLSEPLLILLFLSTVMLFSKRHYFLTCVACGMLVLTKPGTEMVVLITLIFIFKRVGIKKTAKCLGIVFLVVLPWTFRNYLVLGAPVLETSDGFNLASEYSAVAQKSNSFTDPVFDPAFQKYWPLENNEVRWDHQLALLGITNIEAHPNVILETIKRNIESMFQFRPLMAQPAETSDLRHLRLINDSLPWYALVSVVGWIFVVKMRGIDYFKYFIYIVGWDTISGLFSTGAPRLRASFDLVACIGVGFATYYVLAKMSRSFQRSRST